MSATGHRFGVDPADAHLRTLAAALPAFRQEAGRLARWGAEVAGRLGAGARVLAAGNGGAAALAQLVAGALVGGVRPERPPLAAIALGAETAMLTAVGDDHGFKHVFARQVEAYGRAGDILILISTSGRSRNLLAAAASGRARGVAVWAMTGPAPNPLAEACDDRLAVHTGEPHVVQELHLVAIHLMCEYAERALRATRPAGRADPASARTSPPALVDTEKEQVARDEGEAGGGPTAEQAATHEVDQDDVPYRP